MATERERIEYIFRFMPWDNLSDGQRDLIESFERHFKARGTLSTCQYEILEDIFEKAA